MSKETILWPDTKAGIIISLICGLILVGIFAPLLIIDIKGGKPFYILGIVFSFSLGLYSTITSIIKLVKRNRAKRDITIG